MKILSTFYAKFVRLLPILSGPNEFRNWPNYYKMCFMLKKPSCTLTLYGTTFNVILHIVKCYWDFKGENHEFLGRCLDPNQWNTSRKHCCWASFLLSYFSFILFLLISNFFSLVCIKNWEEGEDLRRTQLLKKCRGFYPKSRWSTLTISL